MKMVNTNLIKQSKYTHAHSTRIPIDFDNIYLHTTYIYIQLSLYFTITVIQVNKPFVIFINILSAWIKVTELAAELIAIVPVNTYKYTH